MHSTPPPPPRTRTATLAKSRRANVRPALPSRTGHPKGDAP